MQEDQLLSGSIADNICFFDPGFDEERMIRSARLAGAILAGWTSADRSCRATATREHYTRPADGSNLESHGLCGHLRVQERTPPGGGATALRTAGVLLLGERQEFLRAPPAL